MLKRVVCLLQVRLAFSFHLPNAPLYSVGEFRQSLSSYSRSYFHHVKAPVLSATVIKAEEQPDMVFPSNSSETCSPLALQDVDLMLIQQEQQKVPIYSLEINDNLLEDEQKLSRSPSASKDVDFWVAFQNVKQDLGSIFQTATDSALISVLVVFGIASLLSYDMQYMRGWTPAEIFAHLPYDSLHLYAVNVEGHPATTALMTSMISYFLGDILAQVITDKARPGSFDRWRGIRWASAGALIHSSFSSVYFPISDKIADNFLGDGAGPLKLMFQIWIDNTIYFPILTLALFIYLGLTSGDNITSAWTSFEKKLVPLGTRAWRFWPLADLLTFGPVPPQFRLLYVSAVRIIWVAIQSSFVAQQQQLEESKKQHAEATDQEPEEEVSGWKWPAVDSREVFLAFMAYFTASAIFCGNIYFNPQ